MVVKCSLHERRSGFGTRRKSTDGRARKMKYKLTFCSVQLYFHRGKRFKKECFLLSFLDLLLLSANFVEVSNINWKSFLAVP